MIILFPERERFLQFFPDRESKMGNSLISRTGKFPSELQQMYRIFSVSQNFSVLLVHFV